MLVALVSFYQQPYCFILPVHLTFQFPSFTPTLSYRCVGVCGRADCVLQVAGGVSGVMISLI